ncbi:MULTISPECIES: alpha/beta hydrolase [Ramlibacter]|uniref:Alpha/beta hydrolase fold domain-containing protein n=1 Tax=Ramlibacter pinisoli TaxID=2682844 RepID=A0A6N8IRI4_9BURK|nr:MULTISPECIES: alpha/beta hydrolase [Ramlibacter]MBA2963874.1 alpha/beta hydrolase [Ramlibacter sp. CGMCC 1.13660]MVQ28840.1 alpha/beta hydrolase fold domain-containing protein [Ramlibacter pinisoli]
MAATASPSPAPHRALDLPGVALPVRLWGTRPRGTVVPLVLHFHGGAFVTGDLDSGGHMAQLLVEVGAVVASLAYPLAPGHRFPDAVEAGYAALEALYRQRARLGGSGAPVYLAGEEAGGNLAAAVAMVARDRSHPPLAGQILVTPMLDPCTATASLRETLGDVVQCKWTAGWRQYLRGPMDAEHPYAVPARAQRLAGLPPALILAGQDDPMRDEALAFAARLRDAGIAVRSEVLGPATGWPDALEAEPADACPCAGAVREHLRAFFRAPAPPH